MIKKTKIVKHKLFKIIGECGDSLDMQTFVVGGWVRDSILNRISKDVEFDIVCDGDGIMLAKKVANKLNVKNINIYKTFGTV